MRFSRVRRLIHIHLVLAKYHILGIIPYSIWWTPLLLLAYCHPFYWRKTRTWPRAVRLRCAIEELGPIFVKIGQILSTRRDWLPDDVAFELAKLQDKVPPFSGEQAKKIVEITLGCPIEMIFAEFNIQPLASASIAQVHPAVLLNGEAVVVKVLRPDMHKVIERDAKLLLFLATWAERWQQTRHLKPKQIATEVIQTLFDELDLLREGANASQLRRHFCASPILYIPKLYLDYCRSNVLVMERIYGIPIYDIEQLRHSNVDLRKLAQYAIEIFLTQVFRDRFFHADLHPGNLFVNTKDPENPVIIAVDFGIVGSLNRNDQRYIAENMLAFFKRDYQRIAELHIASGWLAPDTRIDQFESAIRTVSEPIFERPLQDISFGQLLLRLFQVARHFHINIQPQLVLLQKTLLSVEGLSHALAPDLNLWVAAAPQIEKWIKREVGFKAFLRRLRENLPVWSEQWPEMPSLLYEVLKENKQQQERERFERLSVIQHKKKRNLKLPWFLYGALTTSVIIGLYNYLAGGF